MNERLLCLFIHKAVPRDSNESSFQNCFTGLYIRDCFKPTNCTFKLILFLTIVLSFMFPQWEHSCDNIVIYFYKWFVFSIVFYIVSLIQTDRMKHLKIVLLVLIFCFTIFSMRLIHCLWTFRHIYYFWIFNYYHIKLIYCSVKFMIQICFWFEFFS